MFLKKFPNIFNNVGKLFLIFKTNLSNALFIIRGSFEKFPDCSKFYYFRQADLNENLAPAFFDHAASKSEVGSMPKKIRKVFSLKKSTRTLLSVVKICVCFVRRLKTKTKFIEKL